MAELVASRSVASVLAASVAQLESEDAMSTRQFLTALQDLPTFVREIARTVDEHDTDATMGGGRTLPGKPFPDWAYLYEVVREHQEHRLLLIEKARQLMLTWLVAAIVVWEVRRSSGQRVAWVSLKADHADAALQRMWEIITRLPGRPEKSPLGHAGFRDAGGVLWTRAYGRIQIPQLSCNIHGMSQDINEARSLTMSGMVFDEWAFMPGAREAYSAAKPTIDGGWIIGITTPGPFGFIADLFRGKAFGVEGE